MAAKAEEMKILEKVFDLAKRELVPVEYAKFLTIVTPKIGDSVKEIRKFRDTVSEEEFLEMLKKKEAKITPLRFTGNFMHENGQKTKSQLFFNGKNYLQDYGQEKN
jgi:hypothetical protein